LAFLNASARGVLAAFDSRLVAAEAPARLPEMARAVVGRAVEGVARAGLLYLAEEPVLSNLADEDPLTMVRRRGLDLFRTVDDMADCRA